MVQTDAPYKLTWQGYPILLVGTSDAAKVFHTYAAAVTKRETAADFKFLFRALHEVNLEWKPSILLARFPRCFWRPLDTSHVLLSHQEECGTFPEIINEEWNCWSPERRYIYTAHMSR